LENTKNVKNKREKRPNLHRRKKRKKQQTTRNTGLGLGGTTRHTPTLGDSITTRNVKKLPGVQFHPKNK